MYTFYTPPLYLPKNKEPILRIETKSSYFRDKIGYNYAIAFGQKPLKKNAFCYEDFVLRIDLSLKKINKEKKPLNCSVQFSYLNHKDKPTFLFSTPIGSWFKIDYLKRYARGSMIKDDNLEEYLMLKINSFIFLLMRIFRIHSVCIKRKMTSSLFIGKKGVGKTTLAGLLLKEDRKSKIIEDDSTFVLPIADSIYALSLKQNGYYPISHLFFIERKAEKLSEIYPISHKEAFKRIVFHSDVILNKDDNQVEYRLKILEKLTSRCRCFVFVNGKDLRNNSIRLKRLIDKVI